MSDRELLEWAAIAVGVDAGVLAYDNDGTAGHWNPLEDDGDAFCLAVDLNIRFGLVLGDSRGWVEVGDDYYHSFEWDMHKLTERYSATRRAIVQAAAALGKAMP